MGDLDRLREVTKGLEPKVGEMVEETIVQKRKAAELQSMMLKGSSPIFFVIAALVG